MLSFSQNFIFLEAVVPGAGAFEIAAHCMLKEDLNSVKGRGKLGVQVCVCDGWQTNLFAHSH